MTVRIMCGAWIEACSVVRPPNLSVTACEPRASRGSAAWRPETISNSTMAWARSVASASSGVAISPATITLEGDSSG